MKMRSCLSGFIFFTALISSCQTTEPAAVKAPEKVYRTFPGKAKIVEIVPLKENGNIENPSYVSVYFDFMPDNSSALNSYAYPKSSDKHRLLEYDNRNNFHTNWVAKWGIKTGNEYRASRVESSGEKTGAHVFYDVELTPEK